MNPRHAAAVLLVGIAFGAAAQERRDPTAVMAAQREAMAALAFMDGVWRGPATTVLPSGDKHAITQTERIGPLLGGTVKVIEGRGYEPDGKTTFNALGVISYDVGPRRTRCARTRWACRGTSRSCSRATASRGRFQRDRSRSGSAVVKDGTWTEVGDRIAPGKDPVRFFEMKLTRVGDSDWPGAGAIPLASIFATDTLIIAHIETRQGKRSWCCVR